MATERNFYDILEVDKTASQDQIKKSYTNLILKYHPDKESQSDTSKFMEIDTAYKTLRDPEKRKQYDAEQLQKQSSHVIIHDTVKLEDFKWDHDSDDRYYECKCFGLYMLPHDYEELDPEPETIIYCDECSLAIKVIH